MSKLDDERREQQHRIAAAEMEGLRLRIEALERGHWRILTWIKTIFPRPMSHGRTHYFNDLEVAKRAWDALFDGEEK